MYSVVTIKYNEDSFNWVLNFMIDKGYTKSSGDLSVQLKKKKGHWLERMFD